MYLGVDGGGTKTAFVLIDADGNILARHEGKTSYYIEVGLESVKTTILDGLMQVMKKASQPIEAIKFAFFGLPAFGEDSRVQSELQAIPATFLSVDKYACGNDMICGWASALGGNDGINIVAGTGSIAYGEHQSNKARCGGWGEIFSDEGSAYWIARKGLDAFTRMSDGRLPQTELYSVFKHHFHLQHDLDMCGIVLNQWGASRSKIAHLSMLVFDAAEKGDVVAKQIFIEAANELALLIDTTKNKLGYAPGEEVYVSYSGGVFNVGDLVLEPLKETLTRLSSSYRLVSPMFQPDVGSALYAGKLASYRFSDQALARLKL